MSGEETFDELMHKANDDAGIPMHRDTLEMFGMALKSLLVQKSEDKSEAFLLAERDHGFRSTNGTLPNQELPCRKE